MVRASQWISLAWLGMMSERGHVVVSTVPGKHGDEDPVPLIRELGALESNARLYPDEQEEELRQVSQPQRSDPEP